MAVVGLQRFRGMCRADAVPSPDRTEALLDEANRAFEYNTALFDELKTPPALFVSSSAVEVPSPLASPVDSPFPPASPVFEDMGNSPLLDVIKKSGQSKTVFEAPEPPKSEWVYQTASVIAFIAAFGIAHFALVVGGFTGARGYAKLEMFQDWMNDMLSSVTQA